jgi:hypothetical protein
MPFPEQGDDSGFDVIMIRFDASSEVHLHSSLYPAHDVIKGQVAPGQRGSPVSMPSKRCLKNKNSLLIVCLS